MSAVINFSINLDKLDKNRIQKTKSGTFYNFGISVNDETGQYGDNCGVFISQTKEEREAKQKRSYVGNGKVVWTDGNIVLAEKVERTAQAAPVATEEADFPF